jgi:hypothetical protein
LALFASRSNMAIPAGFKGTPIHFRGRFPHAETRSFGRNGAILRHFERDAIPYALETVRISESEFAKTLSPSGESSRILILRCRGSNPPAPGGCIEPRDAGRHADADYGKGNVGAVAPAPMQLKRSSPDLSPLPATNDKAIATGAKPWSINLIILSVG